MEQKLISVIIPVYKVEKYLRRCLDSVTGQTYENLEIVLIDDGSPDNCGSICDEYALKDNRIKVIHKGNTGLSDSRNEGIEASHGEYVLFVDSDDYIHPKMIEELYTNACEKNADVVVCDYVKVNEDEERVWMNQKLPVEAITITDDNRLKYMLGDTKIIFTVAWNKLFRRTVLGDIRFPFGKVHEDEFWTYKILHRAQAVVYLKETLYYYVQRDSSIMGEHTNIKSLQRLDAYKERIQYYKDRKMPLYEYQMINHYRYFMNDVIDKVYKQGKCTKEEISSYIYYIRKEILLNIWKYNVSMKTKLGYVLYAVAPGIYKKMKY